MANKEQWDMVKWERKTSPLGEVLASNIIRSFLSKDNGRNALDLACGDGLLTKEICKHFDRVVGVDASTQHIEVARQIAPEAELHVAMLEDFDPKGETFDRIYMLSILEHLDYPVEALRLVGSWLNDNGSLLVYVPHALSLNRRIGREMGLITDCYDLTPQDIEVGHRRLYDMVGLLDDIDSSGMTVLDSGGDMIKPFSNTQMEWFLQGWGKNEPDADWGKRLCEALCSVGDEFPSLTNAIWVRCKR